MEFGLVEPVDINEQMRAAYLDYAMSVIVARALPDARDGSKAGSPANFIRHARYGYSGQHTL